MKKRFLSILLLFVVFSDSFSQIPETKVLCYFQADTTYNEVSSPENLSPYTQFLYIKEAENGTKQVLMYTPDDIDAWGIPGGVHYDAKEIVINNTAKKVFLQRLSKGDIPLYKYIEDDVSYYFYEIEGVMKPLTKDDINPKVENNITDKAFSDYPEMHDNIRITKYNDMSLANLFDSYNLRKPEKFAYSKFLLELGITMEKNFFPESVNYSSGNEVVNRSDIEPYYSYAIGVLYEVPVRNKVSQSVTLGLRFASHNQVTEHKTINFYAPTGSMEVFDRKVYTEHYSFGIPVKYKYYLSQTPVQVYLSPQLDITANFGITDKDEIYYAGTYYTETENSYIGKMYAGIGFGIGVAIPVSYKNYINLEPSYRYQYGFSSSHLNRGIFMLAISYNLF